MWSADNAYSCDHCRKIISDDCLLTVTFRVDDGDKQRTQFHFHGDCVHETMAIRTRSDGERDRNKTAMLHALVWRIFRRKDVVDGWPQGEGEEAPERLSNE